MVSYGDKRFAAHEALLGFEAAKHHVGQLPRYSQVWDFCEPNFYRLFQLFHVSMKEILEPTKYDRYYEFEVSKDSSSIKVIDFGLAELFEADQKAM